MPIPDLRRPLQCHLWEQRQPDPARDELELVERYDDDSHHWRELLRCRICAQLYFHEFYEVVDWENGNDDQYNTYVPIELTDLDAIRATSHFELLTYTPRIQKDFPRTATEPTSYWVRPPQ